LTAYNLVIAGVGGQGVITASALLARSAIASGLDVRMYGSYGMSQRGGSVSAQLRIGERVLNARIEKGGAALVLALDLVEAVRWAPHLASGGRLVASGSLVPPAGKVVRDGGARHIDFLRGVPGAVVLDAGRLSGEAGQRGENAVLLGAASAVPGFPLGPDAIEQALRDEFGARSAPVLAAFRRGAEALK
jgi:indolepyruvate ferredoxin oxidoreductase beta subunit